MASILFRPQCYLTKVTNSGRISKLALKRFISSCYVIHDKVQPKHQLLVIFNTLRPKQNARHFPDDIFKSIFFNENVQISIKISLKFVPSGPIINIPSLVQIMAWRRPGDKPLYEPMVVTLSTHICVIRPQWVNAPDLSQMVSDNWDRQL